jgi:hypothetical protein
LEDELGFEEVCCAEGETVVVAEVVEEGWEDVRMMGVQFDLTGEINEEVIVVISGHLFV